MMLRLAALTAVLGFAVPAQADTVKAQILCGIIKKGKVVTTIPTSDGRKLDDPISCAVHVDQGSGDLMAYVWAGEDGDKHKGAISSGNDLEVSLEPVHNVAMSQYAPCTNFTIYADIARDGETVWHDEIKVVQSCTPDCPDGCVNDKPGGDSQPDPPAIGGYDGPAPVWVGGKPSLADPIANEIAMQFAENVQLEDMSFFAGVWPKGGTTVKKKKIKAFKIGADLKDQLGVWPQYFCFDEEAHTDCSWGEWDTSQRSKKEFWIYAATGSGYGKFPAFVFKKKGKTWKWSGMAMYDVGPP
jgi:hypothetical protein